MKRYYYYVLDEREPVPCDDVLVWSDMADRLDERQVARTEGDGWVVSTVFVGVNMNFVDGGPPLLFETALLRQDGSVRVLGRYATWAEAQAGHDRAVAGMVIK